MTIDTITYNRYNRRDVPLQASKVKEILPEHFIDNYPDLINFLEHYYTFLDSDSTYNFNRAIQSISTSRDIEDASLAQLNLLFKEIGANIVSTNYFRDPRSVARLLANFYRVKGSLYSAEGFFKAFYNTDVEIIYPKRYVFEVGTSFVGPENLSVIQDGALYQTLSVLLRSGLPISEWGDLYKKLVHPAGLYLGSEVTFTSIASFMQNPMPAVTFDVVAPSFIGVGGLETFMRGIGDYRGIAVGDSAGSNFRIDMNTTVEEYSTIYLGALEAMYSSFKDILSVSSPTLDEDSDVGIPSIDMSNTVELMDEVTLSLIPITVASPPALPTPTAPRAFSSTDWLVSDLYTSGDILITINALPLNGGSVITDIEYQVNGTGSWISLGSTELRGYPISGFTNDVAVSIALRAVNIISAGVAVVSKLVTPTDGVSSPPITLSSYTENLDSDPPTFGFTTSDAGVWTWDFHSDSDAPIRGAGDIASGIGAVVVGSNSLTINLSPYPGQTGYLFHRVVNNDMEVSNILRSTLFTTAS